MIVLDAGEAQRHGIDVVNEKSPQRLYRHQYADERGLLAGGCVRRVVRLHRLRLLDEERRDQVEQEYDHDRDVDEHVVVPDRTDRVGANSERP